VRNRAWQSDRAVSCGERRKLCKKDLSFEEAPRTSFNVCHAAECGGVADEWVTQLLRQSDSKVIKKYSQMKLRMQREALEKLNRLANEMTMEVTTAVQGSKSLCTVPVQF
jgi:hypothetical protein